MAAGARSPDPQPLSAPGTGPSLSCLRGLYGAHSPAQTPQAPRKPSVPTPTHTADVGASFHRPFIFSPAFATNIFPPPVLLPLPSSSSPLIFLP